MKIPAVVFAIALFCASPLYAKGIDHASGKPEVTIQGSSKQRITDSLSEIMADNGYSIKSIDEYNLVFGKKIDSFAASFMYGSNFNVKPEARITYSLINVPGGVRVIATIEMVSNPGTGFESADDISRGKDAESVRKILEDLKEKL